MFTQAGFNHRVRRICFGRVSRIGRWGVVYAQLVQWPETGEMAWASDTQIAWPEQVVVHNFVRPDPACFTADPTFPFERIPA